MAEADRRRFQVEVVWIGVEPPLRVSLEVDAGSSVAEVLAQSRIAARIAAHVAASAPSPAVGAGPLDGLGIAVFGRLARPDDPVHDHDRIELLPPLTVDPKLARQRRAEHRRRENGERRWTPDRERPAKR
jgi:putative ubiquitin-RnfH superfamily antitoxin RatB of RatAB toxin-antitoxin module